MKNLKIHIILFVGLLLTGFTSCKNKSDNKVVIRGKIINPQTDEIYISRDILFQNADTIKLIGENQIKTVIKAPEEGLYLFFVFPEFQTIYLKPGDSLAFHINVEEFDESLSFSGSLGRQNNLLMALFLENEKESNYFYSHKFDFQPDIFLNKIDSFDHIKAGLIQNYNTDIGKTDPKFKAIAELTGQSMNYNLMEIYPLKNPNRHLPKNYYDFEQIFKQNLADPNVFYMYSFADAFINKKIDRKTTQKNIYIQRAHQIQKNINDAKFKDNLLTQYCLNYIRKNQIYKKDSTIQTYFQLIKNQSYKEYCRRLVQKNNAIKKGQTFPNLELVNKHRKIELSNSILKDKKVCISFWDLKQRKNFMSNLRKLKAFKKENPDVNFIIINLNPGQVDQWKMAIPDLPEFKFYQLKNYKDLQLIEPYHLSQVFLVNNTIINKSLVNMYKPNFDKILMFFSEQK